MYFIDFFLRNWLILTLLPKRRVGSCCVMLQLCGSARISAFYSKTKTKISKLRMHLANSNWTSVFEVTKFDSDILTCAIQPRRKMK